MATTIHARRLGAVLVCVTCSGLGWLASDVAASAQAAVPTIASREGSRTTGRTGAPDLTGPTPGSNPNGWPTPNGGQGWQVLGQPSTSPYQGLPVGQTFGPSGLTSQQPPPGDYRVDREGNIIYINPITGGTQTFGTNIQRVR